MPDPNQPNNPADQPEPSTPDRPALPAALSLNRTPTLSGGRMLLGMSGWMNGGEVSTGVIDLLLDTFDTQELGRIDPEPFYLRSLPAGMEDAEAFRPFISVEDGLVVDYDDEPPQLSIDVANLLVLMITREPNLQWDAYADCIFSAAERAGVRVIYFVGSIAGAVPHTREPRIFSVVTDPAMKPAIEQYGLRFTSYEGPGSFVTRLMTMAPDRGIQMASVIAEVPAYIQGTNPKCIEAVIRKLSSMLGLSINTDKLRKTSDRWERKVNAAVTSRDELNDHVTKLEADYDNEVFDANLGDLRDWLEQKGIRLD